MRAPWTLCAVLAAVALLALLAGCGDGSGDDAVAPVADQTAPPFLNFHEHDFAAHPTWRANGDQTVFVELENPAAPADGPDTGNGPGVDAIPLTYAAPAERTYCWDSDPDNPVAGTRVPHSMTLLDRAGREVAYVEEDGECVTRRIAAGDYTMEFTYGDGTGEARDMLFVLPGWRAPETDVSLPSGAIVPPPRPPRNPLPLPPILPVDFPPTSPACPLVPPDIQRYPFDQVMSGQMFIYRSVIDGPRGDTGGFPWVLPGGCADVGTISSGIDPPFPDGKKILLAFMPLDTFARVYAEPNYRGIRIPVKSLTLDSGVTFALPGGSLEPPALGYIGSVAGEAGLPDGNRDTLIRTRSCDRCNLQSIDLHGRDLSGVSLRGADFAHAELSGTIFSGSHAQEANFQSANLTGAKFIEAHLESATFESAGPVWSTNANYPPADLTRADFSRATMTAARMRGVICAQTVFNGTHLEQADLTGATLAVSGQPPADFTNAFLNGAILTSATGGGVIFTGAKLIQANLQGATLNGARMNDAVLTQAVMARDPGRLVACQLSGAYLANADLSSAEATGVNLRGAHWYGPRSKAVGAVLINADLNGAELSGTDFTDAYLANATFDGAKCVACKFNRARMAGSSSQTMDGAKFNGALLYGADLSQATVSGCVFADAIMSFGSGSYIAARAPEFPYVPRYDATMLGELVRAADVICPDGGLGPCSPTPRLLPHSGTPTPTTARTSTPTVAQTATAAAAQTPTPSRSAGS